MRQVISRSLRNAARGRGKIFACAPAGSLEAVSADAPIAFDWAQWFRWKVTGEFWRFAGFG
jgi:hypothetical protein